MSLSLCSCIIPAYAVRMFVQPFRVINTRSLTAVCSTQLAASNQPAYQLSTQRHAGHNRGYYLRCVRTTTHNMHRHTAAAVVAGCSPGWSYKSTHCVCPSPVFISFSLLYLVCCSRPRTCTINTEVLTSTGGHS